MLARNEQGLRPRWTIVALLMVALTLLLAACSEDGSEVTLPEGVTLPEVEAPDIEAPDIEAPDIEAPDVDLPEAGGEAEAPAAEDDGSTAPIWVIVLLGLIIVGFIAYFGARSGSRRQAQSAPVETPPQQPPAAPAAWQEGARTAYADARWLYEEMTVDLATWRGDTLFEAETAGGSAALDTAHQSAWNQLPSRMGSARDALYRVESANDPHASQVAKSLVDQLNSTRSAVDRLANARRQRRMVEAESAGDSAAVAEARSSESRAADDLAAERRRLGDATANLSGLI